MKHCAAILAPGWCSAAVLVSLVCGGCAQERTTAQDAPLLPGFAGFKLTAGPVVVAPASEPGERLVLSGMLSDARGRPVPGAGILAYHQDAQGHYVPHLRARFRTGSAGEFRLNTIVPGGMVRAGGEPPHIHFEVEARAHDRQQLTTYLLLDRAPGLVPAPTEQRPPLFPDPMKGPVTGLGVPGGIRASRDSTGVWRATANLVVK